MPALFQGQRRNEEVVLFTKQHPFILLRPMLLSATVLFVPLIANIFLPFGTVLAVFLLLSLAIATLHALGSYHAWNNSIALLTTERVVLLVQKGLLSREFSECGLHTIQQVSHEVKGPLSTLFGFGNIQIYTGGVQKPFTIPNTPNPYEIQQEIQKAAAGESFSDSEEEDLRTEPDENFERLDR